MSKVIHRIVNRAYINLETEVYELVLHRDSYGTLILTIDAFANSNFLDPCFSEDIPFYDYYELNDIYDFKNKCWNMPEVYELVIGMEEIVSDSREVKRVQAWV